jgi:pyruvate formate lyase activating enzyme
MEPALEYVKFVHYDIKSLDDEKHRSATGVSNVRIIENLRNIRSRFPALKVVVRTPVIPGFNDTEEDIRAIARLTAELEVEYQLLPYHRLGTQKYTFLDRQAPMGEVVLDEQVMTALNAVVAAEHATDG